MRTVDTNIVARFILNDDPTQSPTARAVIIGGAHVPLTVSLESAWLFRSRYKLSRAAIRQVLLLLIDLPSITVDEPDLVRWALDRYECGADVADMIRIAASIGASVFLGFEDRLADKAGPNSPVPVEKP